MNDTAPLIRTNRIKRLLDRKTLLLLINAFVFSKLFYCPPYGVIPQKQALKNCNQFRTLLRKYDHEGRFKSLRWLPIADKLLLNVSVMVYKGLNGRAPDYLSQKFTRRQAHHDRNTRYKKDLNLLRCRLKTGQRSFAFRGAYLFEQTIQRHEGSSILPNF